jgi:hypothetical protein
VNLEVQSLLGHHGRGHGRGHHVHDHVHDHELHLNNSLFSTIVVVVSGGSHLVTLLPLNFEFDSVPFSISSLCLSTTVTVHHPYTPTTTITMSQPEKVTPSYLGPAGQQAPPSIYAVLKDQVMAPQYRDDNLRYVYLLSQRFFQHQTTMTFCCESFRKHHADRVVYSEQPLSSPQASSLSEAVGVRLCSQSSR